MVVDWCFRGQSTPKAAANDELSLDGSEETLGMEEVLRSAQQETADMAKALMDVKVGRTVP